MIFKNETISSVQLRKMIVLSTLGITCFLVTGLGVEWSSRDGILCLVIGAILTFIYAAFIIYLCDLTNWNFCEYVRKYFGKKVEKTLYFIFMIKYFVISIVVLSIFVKIVKEELLGERSSLAIIIPTIILVIYAASKGIEARGRMAQSLYYFILIPLSVLAVLSIKDVDKYYLIPLFTNSSTNIFTSGLWLFLIFSPLEIILFISSNLDSSDYKKIKKNKWAIYHAIIVITIFNIVYYVLNVGNLSINNILANKYEPATIRLVGKLKIGGLFLERQDGLFLLFFLASIFMTISSFVYYTMHLGKRLSEQKVNNRLLAFVTLVFVVAGSQLIIMNCKQFRDTRAIEDAQVEIENRAYANAVFFEADNQEYKVTLVFAHNGDESDTVSFNVKRPVNLVDQYSRTSSKKLDLSHTRVIGIDKEILKLPDRYEELINYLSKSKEISKNVFIIQASGKECEFSKLDENLSIEIGSYVYEMFKNNLKSLETTLYDICKVNEGSEESVLLPNFSCSKDGMEYKGVILLAKKGYVEQFDDNSSSIMNLVDGKKGYTIALGSNHSYTVDSNEYYIKASMIGDKTIHVKVYYNGNLSTLVEDDLSESEINEILEQIIYDRITLLLNDYLCDPINIYKCLSLDCPTQWSMYGANHTKMYSNIYIEVITDYKNK